MSEVARALRGGQHAHLLAGRLPIIGDMAPISWMSVNRTMIFGLAVVSRWQRPCPRTDGG
jgi:hypothetical protein